MISITSIERQRTTTAIMNNYVLVLGNVDEVIKFLDTYNLSGLSCEDTENLNRLIASNRIEFVVTSLQ